MQTVQAQTILDGAAAAIGWDVTQLEDRQEQMRREALSLALQEIWQAWWWEQLMVSVQMSGATVYANATTFNAGSYCYYPATQLFYQAMRTATGQVPATYSNGNYATNTAYWADARPCWTAPDYATGINDTGLPIGGIVRNPTDGFYYQLFTYTPQITVTGAGTAAANGTYTWNGSYYLAANGYTVFLSAEADELGGPLQYAWHLSTDGSDQLYQQADEQGAPPPAVDATWQLQRDGALPMPTITVVNGYYPAPPNSSNWGLLSPFSPTISVPGTVRSVTRLDPRGIVGPQPYEWAPELNTVRVYNLVKGVPWVWYRRPTPILTGDDFDPTAIYTAEDPASLVFDS